MATDALDERDRHGTSMQGDARPMTMSMMEILEDAIAMVNAAKTMPLSSSVLIQRDELLDLLEAAMTSLPEEIREAQWMIRDRQEYLDRVALEAHEILDAARGRAESLVSKTDIVRQANAQASRILQRAREEASKLRHESNDYADQRLAALEIALVNTLKSVRAGRERLAPNAEPPQSKARDAQQVMEDAFFDQDR